MTWADLKVIGGQSTLGGIFELFYPKWGWVNGGSSCGPPYLPIYAEYALKRRDLDSGCTAWGLKKIKFADFEQRPPKEGGHFLVNA
jgi:hypothetical protein